MLHPGCKVFHYVPKLFDGIKAFCGENDKIQIFRIDKNMKQIRRTAFRARLPSFEPKEFGGLIRRLILKNIDWMPKQPGHSIRPTVIGINAVLGLKKSNKAKLFVILTSIEGEKKNGDGICFFPNPKFVQSFPGNVGEFKMRK